MCDMTRYYKGCSNEKYTFTEYEELEYGLLDNKNGKVLGGEEILDLLNHLSKENEQLREENEEYEEESKDMQTKINVLYNEAKKHMSSTEWEKFNRRIIEREEELGIKWVRL